MGCVSMEAFLLGGDGISFGGATDFTKHLQPRAALTTAVAQEALRGAVQGFHIGPGFPRPMIHTATRDVIPQTVQSLALGLPPKPEAHRAHESPGVSPVSTVSGGAQLSTAPSSQTSGALQPSTGVVRYWSSWTSNRTPQLTAMFFQFAVARPWRALQASLSPFSGYAGLAGELLSAGAGDVQRLCIAPAVESATTAARGATTALAVRCTEASDVLRASHTRVTASFASRLEQATNLLRFPRSAHEDLRTRCAIRVQTVLRRIFVRVLPTQPTGEIPPGIAPSVLPLAPAPNRQAAASALPEPLPDQTHPLSPALTNPPPLVSPGLSVARGDELPSPSDAPAVLQKPSLLDSVRATAAAVKQRGITTAQSTFRALAVSGTQALGGLSALTGRATAFSISLLPQQGRNLCVSVTTTAQALFAGFGAWAGTQVRRTAAAGALTGEAAGSILPVTLPQPNSAAEIPQVERSLEDTAEDTAPVPFAAASVTEGAPQVPPTSSHTTGPEGSTDSASRAAPVSSNPLSPTAPLSGGRISATPPRLPTPPVATPIKTNPPVGPLATVPSPLPAPPAAGPASSPIVAPSTQVTLTGLNRGVTVPIVGSLVGAVMFPVRVLETVGFTIATLFYGIKNGLTRDVAKRVDHSYGERARQSAKGVIVAVISIIPILGPFLARPLLNRWVQPRATTTR
jgi:hypothetical protein